MTKLNGSFIVMGLSNIVQKRTSYVINALEIARTYPSRLQDRELIIVIQEFYSDRESNVSRSLVPRKCLMIMYGD